MKDMVSKGVKTPLNYRRKKVLCMALVISQISPSTSTALVQDVAVVKVTGGEVNGFVNVAIIQDTVEIRSVLVPLDASGEAYVNYQFPVAGTYAVKAFLGTETVQTSNITVS